MNEDRQKIWNNYKGEKVDWVRHNFLDYDRYFEASLIEKSLKKNGIKIDSNLCVVDYGCCVADYGIYFARLGACVHLVEKEEVAIDFAMYRFGLENLNFTFEKYGDVIIFGEVLEHIHEPLAVLKQAAYGGSKGVFTSSYPFRSDDADDHYWTKGDHGSEARLAQPACREFLRSWFVENKLEEGEMRLWVKQ